MKRLLPILLLVFSVGAGAYDEDDLRQLYPGGKLKVPDWDSPDWINFHSGVGIDLDLIKIAEMWGVMTGMREVCSGDSDNDIYLLVIAMIATKLGNTEDDKQYTYLILHWHLQRDNAKGQVEPEDCDSPEITKWLDAQDKILRLVSGNPDLNDDLPSLLNSLLLNP